MNIKKLARLTLIGGIIFIFALQSHAQCTGNVNSFPYNEGFEFGDGNWTHGGTASDWALGKPMKAVINTAAAGNFSWITGGLTGSQYNNGENSWLQSPCFDFSGLVHPEISFAIFWETEKKYDGANMEYSTNGGTSWAILGSINDDACTATNWYNNASVNFLGNVNGWSGNVQPTSGSCQGGSGSGQWLAARHDLSFLAGVPNVIFRFRFGAGTTCNGFDGFAIDEIKIAEAPGNSADFTYSCNANRDVSFSSTTSLCPASYTWDFGDPASGAANNTSSSANPNHTFSAAGTYTVNLTVTFSSGVPVVATHTISILDVSINQLNGLLCNGDRNGSLQAIASGGSGSYNYTWNTTPPQNTATINNLGVGSYTVTVTNPSACATSSTHTLSEPTAIAVNVVTSAANCGNANGSASASASGGVGPYQYSWSNGANTSSINNLSPGNYSLTVKDANNCSLSKNNIVIADNNNPVAVSLGNDTSVCKGQTVLLNPGNYSSYKWQDNSTRQTFLVTATGKYWVTVTDVNGCKGTDTISVITDCSRLYFPAAFTPNRDTRNDEFGPLGNLGSVQNYSLNIYDRYGQLIFHSTNPYEKWNGSNKGSLYNTGAFLWFANYNITGQPPVFQKGMVILLH